VINASLAGVVRAATESGRFRQVLGALHGIEGVLADDLVDLTAQPAGFLERLVRTPSAILGSCRYKLLPGDVDRALEVLRRRQVSAFVYIGGNDSADTSHQLAEAARAAGYDLAVVGVPKTIDNDHPEKDHCPGYGSAARFLALAAMEVGADTRAMCRSDPVRVIEVMGRHAGWLAAASALGRERPEDAPHLVLLPERPHSEEAILSAVSAAHHAHGYAVVVLSENQPDPTGAVLGSAGGPRYVVAFGHPYHDSPGLHKANRIREDKGLRARYDKPGALQKTSMAAASTVDHEEAERCGRAAVRLALDGRTDQMVILVREDGPGYRCRTASVPLTAIANRQRRLPDAFIDPRGMMPSAAFRGYALPLLGDPLPELARLQRLPGALRL
jgi:6-phosphofructokinase 1